MDEALEGLKPESVWNYFDMLRKIPRCSKNESASVEFVLKSAEELGLEVQKDEAENVVIRKPASPGYEDHPGVCLQGHLDMVCEKNADVTFDFAKDAIQLKRDGKFLKANGTTLGADNGIGCAILLALAKEKALKHPPLELLFTVDEETGLTGASKLTGDFLTYRKLINADSEDLDTITIGCAGGGDTSLTLPLGPKQPVEGGNAFEIIVKGLKGGHSGVDINLGRANAIKSLARVLFNIASVQKVQLIKIAGGNKRNAIPREAGAKVLLEDSTKAENIIKRNESELRDEFEGIEDSIEIATANSQGTEGYSQDSTINLISLLCSLPHGYLAFNPHIPKLVDTSTNLATLDLKDDNIIIGCNTRSSVGSAIEVVRDQIEACGRLAGATCVKSDSYPSWKPNMKSELLGLAKNVYKEKFGEDPKVEAIHAGLETGIIGEHFPGMDMISIGPDIEFPHSPDERLGTTSVTSFWDFLVSLLEKL